MSYKHNLLQQRPDCRAPPVLDNIYAAQAPPVTGTDHCLALLGLGTCGVLTIGFINAHGIARRFGAPIEALLPRRQYSN